MPAEVVDLVEIRAVEMRAADKPLRVEAKYDERGRLVEGVVRGVKILGTSSPNPPVGRSGVRRTRYSDAALLEAERLYEGLQSYIDHPANRDPNGERSYRDRFGRFRNVKAKPGDGLYGDYVVNPRHPVAEQFLWDAENNPAAVGISHNARGTGSVQGDEFVIESVKFARSGDVVTEPATTVSLFESKENPMGGTAPTTPAPTTNAPAPSTTPAPASTPAPAPAAPATTTMQVPVTVVESRPAPSASAAASTQPTTVELLEQRLNRLEESLKAEKAESDKLRVQLAGRERKERVDALLIEARLPGHAVTEVFKVQLLEAKDDAAVKALLEDRKRIAWHQSPGAPPSGSAASVGVVETSEQFLESIKKGGR
jgi:hypothetical protein